MLSWKINNHIGNYSKPTIPNSCQQVGDGNSNQSAASSRCSSTCVAASCKFWITWLLQWSTILLKYITVKVSSTSLKRTAGNLNKLLAFHSILNITPQTKIIIIIEKQTQWMIGHPPELPPLWNQATSFQFIHNPYALVARRHHTMITRFCRNMSIDTFSIVETGKSGKWT